VFFRGMSFANSFNMRHFLSPYVWLTLFLTTLGCGGEEKSDLTARSTTTPSGIITTGVPGTETGDEPPVATSLSEVDLNDILYTGSATALALKLPADYDALCVDNKTAISWTIAGDATKVSIADSKSCHPTLNILAGFDSNESATALLQLKDKLVKYVVQLKAVDPALCTSNGGMIENNACVYTICKSAEDCAKIATGNDTLYLLDGRATNQMSYATVNATHLCDKVHAGARLIDFSKVDRLYSPPYKGIGANYVIDWDGSFKFQELPTLTVATNFPMLSQVRCAY
jgi:hypothetical protein